MGVTIRAALDGERELTDGGVYGAECWGRGVRSANGALLDVVFVGVFHVERSRGAICPCR